MKTIDWESEFNAEKYAEFCKQSLLYQTSTAALIDIADINPGETILDYACGTGASTKTLADKLGKDCEIFGVDISEAQILEAKKLGWDNNVTFLVGTERALPQILPKNVDIIICNAAFWFLDVTEFLKSINQIGSDSCRIAFNLFGDPMPRKTKSHSSPNKQTDLLNLTREIAIQDFGYQPPDVTPSDSWYERDFADYVELFEDSSFRITTLKARTGKFAPIVGDDSWWEIPVFLTSHVPGLEYEKALTALRKAQEQIEILNSDDNEEVTPTKFSWSYLATRI